LRTSTLFIAKPAVCLSLIGQGFESKIWVKDRR
jgi:hypothetical protein